MTNRHAGRFTQSLVRRCNGTTAGLGYLEVIWIVLEKVLQGQCPRYQAVGYGQSER
jgi:hypothetical protein